MLPFCLKAQYVVLEKILKHNLFKLDKLWATKKKTSTKRLVFFFLLSVGKDRGGFELGENLLANLSERLKCPVDCFTGGSKTKKSALA